MSKSFIKRCIHYLGFDLRRYSPLSSDISQFMAMLKEHKVNLIFDVGANIGQFGKEIRNAGYGGRMVSFEPLTSAHARLLTASNNDPLWDVASQAAIGNEDGEIEIHVSGNSVSSSVLAMLDTHANAAPSSVYVSNEKVPLKRLDTIGLDYIHPDAVLFIKIDTQGYEDRVLQGASKVLARAIGLQLELSFVPLYDGQCLYDEMVAQLQVLGFELWGMTPVFNNPSNGRLLQVDATFFRC